MYIDDQIPIPDSTPQGIREELEELERRYREEGDELSFDCAIDGILGSAKSYALCKYNGFGHNELKQLMHHYGFGY